MSRIGLLRQVWQARRVASRTRKPGKVLVVLHEEEVGGATRALLRVVPLLERNGWELCFWAPHPSPVSELLAAGGWRVSGAQRSVRYSWRSLRKPPGPWARVRQTHASLAAFAAFLTTEAPDLVHANTLLTLPEAAIARAMGYRVAVHVHEMLSRNAKGRAAALVLRASASRAIAVSNACAAALRRAGIAAVVVPNGVSVPAPVERASQPVVVVGTAGTVSHRKGTDVFVAAARDVHSSGTKAKFRIAGALAGGPEASWAARTVALAASSGIDWQGHVDLVDELARWDVFVLPSREDPFPLAVLEAMAAGLPVIASAVDGIPEQIGTAGILIDPDDANALAAAIRGLADSPSTRTRLGREARERVADRFTLERQAEALHDLYRTLGAEPAAVLATSEPM